MTRLFKVIMAAIVAMGMVSIALMHGASDRTAIALYMLTGVGVAALIGAFDVDEPERKNRHLTIGQGIGYISHRRVA